MCAVGNPAEEMNLKYRLAVLAIIFGVVLALVPAALAQMPKPFSADMFVTPGRSGGEAVNGKFFYGGQRMRMEMSARGHESVMITDIPKKVTYMVMPQQRMYMEMQHSAMMRGQRGPDFKPYDASNPCAAEEGTTCKKVGTETVNARLCDKWEFTKGGKPDRTVWIDKQNHIPIKTVSSDGTVFEFKNIKEGPQAASLFDVPSGYQKMDMGGMMGGSGMKPPR